MIRIQALRHPNKYSGTAVLPGKSIKVSGVEVTNKNKFPVYVDTYERKPWNRPKKNNKTSSVTGKKKAKSKHAVAGGTKKHVGVGALAA